MIKLTYFDAQGRRNADVHIAPAHIVALHHGNPSGALVHTTRGTHHVAQSVDQVLTLLGGKI